MFYFQEDFEFDGQTQFQDPRSTSESTTPMEGENMGGWWPEQSAPDTGVRAAGQFPSACTRLHNTRPVSVVAVSRFWFVCRLTCHCAGWYWLDWGTLGGLTGPSSQSNAHLLVFIFTGSLFTVFVSGRVHAGRAG